jgi:hypothetical protein
MKAGRHIRAASQSFNNLDAFGVRGHVFVNNRDVFGVIIRVIKGGIIFCGIENLK